MAEITDLGTARNRLKTFLQEGSGLLVVFTGAGISTESGIPDFRSPGGLWSRMQPIDYRDFVADEDSRIEDWNRRFDMAAIFEKAEPNAAHLVLGELARRGTLSLLITQNVDGLHQRAGVPGDRLVELHGNSTFATCLNCGARAELEEQRAAVHAGQSPVCTSCGGLLKAAVISFGQMLPEKELARAAEAARDCDRFLVIGSSLLVHPAAQLPVLAAQAGAELVIMNREETPVDSLADSCIRTPIAESFAEISRFIGQ
jgi:NAD-dependent deacetylase